MKKLSTILCGILLVVGLMTGTAYPQLTYYWDWLDNGSNDNGSTQNIDPLAPVRTRTVGLYLDGYDCPPADNIFGTQVYITHNDGVAQINSCLAYGSDNGGPWDPAPLSSCQIENIGPGVSQNNTGAFFFIAIPTGKVKLATLVIEGTVVGEDAVGFNLVASNTAGAGDGFTSDCNLTNIYPADASLKITQTAPPCTITIAPDPVTISASSVNPVTQQFTATETGNCEDPNLVWSDTCTGATVDQSGLLTVAPTLVGESCTVCVTDEANTGAGDDPIQDCAAVTIQPGAACDVEIYMGGDPGFCAENCLDPLPVDDPPYNRAGRRGLALTCGDIVDFCACDDCTDAEPELVWSVVCTKPGVATIVPTPPCTARLTIAEDTCSYLAEIVECTVTVNDTVNNSSDSVEIQVGKIIVDLSEEKVTPDTDSVQVDVSVTNNDHTIRAMDIIVDECQAGDDNLVCTGCVADPNRALGFTCTASEQPDGTCRIVLFSAVDRIDQGEGRVATIIYDVVTANDCPECVCLEATSVLAADQFNEELCACTDTGEVCFDVCGDIYPQDCLNPGCKPCGDGVVDLFDILEMVDIILGTQIPTCCQVDNGDVPNGTPPYCGEPAGSINCDADDVACDPENPEIAAAQAIDIFDLLVIIDMALGKPNCCDYCSSGAIF